MFIKNKNLGKLVILFIFSFGLGLAYWQYRNTYDQSFSLFSTYIQKHHESCSIYREKNLLIIKDTINPDRLLKFLLKLNLKIENVFYRDNQILCICRPEALTPKIVFNIKEIDNKNTKPIIEAEKPKESSDLPQEKKKFKKKLKKCSVIYME